MNRPLQRIFQIVWRITKWRVDWQRSLKLERSIVAVLGVDTEDLLHFAIEASQIGSQYMRDKGILVLFFLMIFSVKAVALELIMISSRSCFYCKAFMKEVGKSYDREDIPLAITYRKCYKIDGEKKCLKKGAKFIPTFVIVDDGEEVDRIVGYTGRWNFNDALDRILNEYDQNSQ